MDDRRPLDPRLQQVLEFPLVSGLFGRRSRRFGYGMSIPSGPLAYTSQHEPLALCDLEQALLDGSNGSYWLELWYSFYSKSERTLE
jgi:hypothetical protein